MADTVILDFNDAPPAQGKGNISDRVPAGTYPVVLADAAKAVSKNGKPMVVCQIAFDVPELKGKRLIERFVIPRPNTDDSKFGLQRFHAFLVALGMTEQKGKLSLDLASVISRRCLAEVEDEETEATEEYDARVTSKALAFHRIPKAAAAPKAAAKSKAAPAAETTPAEDPALPDDEAVAAAESEAPAEPELPSDDDDPATALGDLFD